jgi:hypothetical protein
MGIGPRSMSLDRLMFDGRIPGPRKLVLDI